MIESSQIISEGEVHGRTVIERPNAGIQDVGSEGARLNRHAVDEVHGDTAVRKDTRSAGCKHASNRQFALHRFAGTHRRWQQKKHGASA